MPATLPHSFANASVTVTERLAVQPELKLLPFANADTAVKGGENGFLPAAIDASIYGAVRLHVESSVGGRCNGGFAAGAIDLDFEVAVNFSVVCFEFHVGAEIRGQGNIDLTVQGAEGDWLDGVRRGRLLPELPPVERVRDHCARNMGQDHAAISSYVRRSRR